MRKWFPALLVIFALAGPAKVQAQGCAMCSRTAASLDDKGAKGLNAGIIYLALIPLAILGTVGFVWWRSNGQQA